MGAATDCYKQPRRRRAAAVHGSSFTTCCLLRPTSSLTAHARKRAHRLLEPVSLRLAKQQQHKPCVPRRRLQLLRLPTDGSANTVSGRSKDDGVKKNVWTIHSAAGGWSRRRPRGARRFARNAAASCGNDRANSSPLQRTACAAHGHARRRPPSGSAHAAESGHGRGRRASCEEAPNWQITWCAWRQLLMEITFRR